MSLTLHYQPLASYCHKVLIALYENDTPFDPHLVDLGKPEDRPSVRRVLEEAKPWFSMYPFHENIPPRFL